MRRKNTRKPRAERIFATTKPQTAQIEIVFNEDTGEINFPQKMCNVFTEKSYERKDKAKKVLSRIPSNVYNHSFNANEALTNNYDEFFAVDTNTKIIGPQRISVTSLVIAQKHFIASQTGHPKFVGYSFYCEGAFIFRTSDDKPEMVGWTVAIEKLLTLSAYKRCKRIAVIVDSDLGSLEKINEFKLPIRYDYFCPRNITLVYATDAVKDDFANALISSADHAARMIMTEIE